MALQGDENIRSSIYFHRASWGTLAKAGEAGIGLIPEGIRDVYYQLAKGEIDPGEAQDRIDDYIAQETAAGRLKSR
jgi:hypothetical protein